jgi:hypothetical protein
MSDVWYSALSDNTKYGCYPQEDTESALVTACAMIIMIAMSPTELKIYNRYIDEQIPNV